MASQLGTKSGIEILADILKHCDAKTNKNILTGLEKDLPQVVSQLRRQIITFEDLAYCDPRGTQKLLKMISLRDLAVSLKGAPELVLKNLASNMSQRALQDLKEEITLSGPARAEDVENARARIIEVVSQLLNKREIFINRPGEPLAY